MVFPRQVNDRMDIPEFSQLRINNTNSGDSGIYVCEIFHGSTSAATVVVQLYVNEVTATTVYTTTASHMETTVSGERTVHGNNTDVRNNTCKLCIQIMIINQNFVCLKR